MNKDFKPYYAVIFTSTQTKTLDGYVEMAIEMEMLAKQQTGFLGIDSARSNVGISVSYWESLEAIQQWKQHTDHLVAKKKGIKDWYAYYNVKICKVEREYGFNECS
jgi:heme-degrading monooxygenase HmoA